MTGDALVRQYYDALDEHDYDALEAVLSPSFVQQRPDRRFEGREAFVRFMREGRPNRNTRHELDAVLSDADEGSVAVRGRLVDASDGRELFAFADHFDVEGGRLVRLETYTR